jgi:large subunit ribosomal protein L17
MRHRKSGVKLSRTTSHRQAMFRNMVTSLLKHERIQTTDIKAKELRRWVDHIITLAKRGDLHARRQAMAIVREKAVVHKIFAEASEKFGTINGGYTRIVKIGRRPGDAAPCSLIELVSAGETVKKAKKKTKPAGKTPSEATEAKPPEIKEEKPESETREAGAADVPAAAPPADAEAGEPVDAPIESGETAAAEDDGEKKE